MLKPFVGRAYRAPSGYQHDANDTAGDVVRFEQDELGNDIGVDQLLLPWLDTIPAKELAWITKTEEEAARYGDPIQINLGERPIVIGEDGEGGFLVLIDSSVSNIQQARQNRQHGQATRE